MSDWTETNLEDIALIEMGQSPKKEDVNECGDGFPLLNGPTEFGPSHPIPVQFSNNCKRIAPKDSLLFCVRGSTTGRMNWADQKYGIGRGLASLFHKYGKEFNPFLKGLIEYNLPHLLISATGSTFPNVTSKQLKRLKINVPNLIEQKTIAHILGTLDDKIELNRKMNATLEEMAQAMFNSWFVDFDPVLDNALAQGNKIPEALKAKAERRKAVNDSKKLLHTNPELAALFPASFVFNETLNKWIPEGWSIKSIYDFVDIEYGAPFSSKLFNTDGNGTPVIRIRDLKTGTPQNWTTEEHPKGILIKQGDLIVGMDAEFRPCLWQGQDGFLNQRLFRAKPKKDYISNYFLYHALEPLLLYEEQAQVGTTVAHLGKKDIDKFEIIDVGHDLIKEYSKTANPILDRVNTANSEIFTLTTTRDTLLPQLISGRVRVGLDKV